MRLFLFALAVALASAGCQTKSKVLGAPSDAGISKPYEAPMDKVQRATRDALAEAQFGIKEKETKYLDDARYQILAGQGLSAGSTGRYVRVIIENEKTRCTVRVLVESKVDSQAATPADIAIGEDLHKRIAARIAK